jgi:hypothetical protein
LSQVPHPGRGGTCAQAASSRIAPQAKATDRAIDALVYQLSGLNEEEICIVEGK